MAPTKFEMLQNVTVLIGDTNEDRAANLRDGLVECGFGAPIIAATAKDTVLKLESGGVDVAILADTLGGRVFKIIRGVRHNLIGNNPFMVLFCSLAP